MTIKIYEPVVNPETGSIKIETELDPEEIKQLLCGAIMMLLARGMAPKSIVHHFDGSNPEEQEESGEPTLYEGDPQQPFREAVAGQPETPTVVTTPDKLTEEQQKQLLMMINPKDMPQA